MPQNQDIHKVAHDHVNRQSRVAKSTEQRVGGTFASQLVHCPSCQPVVSFEVAHVVILPHIS